MSGFPGAILPRSTGGDAFPRRLGRALQRRWLAYMDWRLRRLAVNLLSRKSDRQLMDMGLSRSQIQMAVSTARGQPGQSRILNGRRS